jgi:hypothetical protein
MMQDQGRFVPADVAADLFSFEERKAYLFLHRFFRFKNTICISSTRQTLS